MKNHRFDAPRKSSAISEMSPFLFESLWWIGTTGKLWLWTVSTFRNFEVLKSQSKQNRSTLDFLINRWSPQNLNKTLTTSLQLINRKSLVFSGTFVQHCPTTWAKGLLGWSQSLRGCGRYPVLQRRWQTRWQWGSGRCTPQRWSREDLGKFNPKDPHP